MAATVTVQAGDSFWSIAAAQVAHHLGHAPSVADVAPYWNVLVQANAGNLVHPGNANLIYPGQVMVVPAV